MPTRRKGAQENIMRSEPIEQWLDSHGTKYTFQTIKLENVDRVASHRNQARIGAPINEDTAVLYGAAMEQGDQFPPIVVSVRNDRKYVVIDGNHRVAAYDLNNADAAEAYVATDLSDAQRASLTFEANTKHGLPTAMAERLRQAIYLVEMGTTRSEAARMLGLPTTRVDGAVQLHTTDKRMQSLGVSRWDRIPSTARRRLYNLRSDKVFKAAAELAVESKMPGIDIERMVSRVNAASRGDDVKQLAVIEDERKARSEEIRASAGGRLGWSRATMGLSSVLSRALRIDPEVIKNDSIGEDMRKRLKARTLEAVQRLNKVAEAL